MKFYGLIASATMLASLAMGGLVSASSAADLTVGANIGNVPWEFQDASGEIVGFEVDLVNEVAKRLGKTVAFENIPFNGLFPAVQSGRINMAVSSITITPKRLESVSFAQPYYDSDQSLTVLPPPASPARQSWPARRSASTPRPLATFMPPRTPRNWAWPASAATRA